MPLEHWVLTTPWALFGAVVVSAAVKLAIARMALRGTDPKDRPAILKALAGLFRADWWTRRKPYS